MPVKHLFSSAKSDGADATEVRASNWNADHAVTNTVAPSTGNFGDIAAAGSSVHPALADHVHGRETNPLTQSAGDETTLSITTVGAFELAPGSTDYQVRWNGASIGTIYGITGQLSGRRLVITNRTNAQYLILAHESASEATVNSKIACPANVDFVLGGRMTTELIWQPTTARWVVAANPQTPSGSIMAYAGATAPPGWLFANGQSLVRTDYPNLFAALGGTASPWGLPDGTHFQVPNMCYDGAIGQGRFPLGRRNATPGDVLAGAAGSMDHAHDNHSAALTIAGKTAGALNGSSATVGGVNAAGAGHDHLAGTLAASGAHNGQNPPYIVVMYIIAI